MTSASALGVLLAPSVPLIMYAIIARVPINTMFLAGVLPAVVMVVFLLLAGGYLRRSKLAVPAATISFGHPGSGNCWRGGGHRLAGQRHRHADRSAALFAAYALLARPWPTAELDWVHMRAALVDCAEVIGGIMVILGMALGLTNYLVDAGISRPGHRLGAVGSAQQVRLPGRLNLCCWPGADGNLRRHRRAGAATVAGGDRYGIDPAHFWRSSGHNIEMGFLCPPAGMNIYFASAMFGKSIRYVGGVGPACRAGHAARGADHLGAAFLATWLPGFVRAGRRLAARAETGVVRRWMSASGNTLEQRTTLRTPAVLRAMSTAALASRSLTMPIRNNPRSRSPA